MKRLLSAKILIVALMSVAATAALHGADDMRRLLTTDNPAFDALFLKQPRNTRLDMVDYYDAGQTTFTADEKYGSKLRIDTLDNHHVRFKGDVPVDIDIYLLTPKNDSVFVTVIRHPLGTGDSAVKISRMSDLSSTASIEPSFSDWLSDDALKTGRAEVLQAVVSYVATDVQVDSENNIVRLINTSVDVPGVAEDIKDGFKREIVYRWNGKNFVASK